MGIGYFQLTVVSESDKYIVGNPQMTFFKAIYKRHTNFAFENFILIFTGETFMNKNSNLGKKMYATIPKNGDLVHKMYLVIDLEDTFNIEGTTKNEKKINFKEQISVLGLSLIDYIEIRIGDQLIDKHTGEWLHIYNELFNDSSKNNLYCEMTNTHINYKIQVDNSRDGRIYIPLQFWFNRNPGLSLPLLALQYSDVKINIKLNSRNKIKNDNSKSSTLQINKVQLLAQYIHLDKEEKTLFASNSHEYLIEQVQSNLRNVIPLLKNVKDKDYEQYQHKFELALNHPIKELIWAIQDISSCKDSQNVNYCDSLGNVNRTNSGNNIFNFWRNLDYLNSSEQIIDATIALNGKQIFEPLNSNYFQSIQKYQHHSGFGYQNMTDENSITNYFSNMNYKNSSGFYTYSFALNPENHQPSGSLNFSKLDKAELRLRIRRDKYTNSWPDTFTIREKLLKVYAINYNILRIVSGHGGLVFQN